MAEGKYSDYLTVIEAVDHLSSIAEGKQLDEGLTKEGFRVIHAYLEDLYEKEREELDKPDTFKGIQSIMLLAKEASQKLEPLVEFKKLKRFYLEKIARRFIDEEKATEEWEKEEFASLDDQRKGLKDLEAVRGDTHYELFFIKKENGLPFFNRDLLRHLRLVGNFDELLTSHTEADPLLAVKKIQDHSLFNSALEIIEQARPLIDAFYREGVEANNLDFKRLVNQIIMALMMAANDDHLLENGSNKGCVQYYADFQYSLRKLLKDELYIHPPKNDPFVHLCLQLVHALCLHFHMRMGDRNEILALLHKIAPIKGEKALKELEAFDEALREKLKLFPSGPVMKTLDTLRGEVEGFDPLTQHNFPKSLFSIVQGDREVTFLHLPSPTHQDIVGEAGVNPEFAALMQTCHVLLIDLDQDTDRSKALKAFARKGEYLTLLTPKENEELKALFFEGKESPEIREISLCFQVLEALDKQSFDLASFTCKDALDHGAMMSGIFYYFCHLLTKGEKWTQKEWDLLIWLLYSPAMTIRERPLQHTYFRRALRAMQALEKAFKKQGKELKKQLKWRLH